MAKRNRYREMESLMTRVIIGDALVFALYLLCAGLGWTVLKVTSAIIAILGSLLCLGWLVITGEFSRRRVQDVVSKSFDVPLPLVLE